MQSKDKSSTEPIQPTFDMGEVTPESVSLPFSLLPPWSNPERRRLYFRENRVQRNAQKSARVQERRKTDPEYLERYRKRKREAWHTMSAERKRKTDAGMMKRRYGITIEQYDEILAAQGGVCLMCMKAPYEQRLVIDHDHATGRVRALLHQNCNATLKGVFGDDPYALHRAFLRFGYIADAIRAPGSYIVGGMAAVR
jgi:hypothetical protein